jgi:PAS domain S-box-containing protein
VALALIALLWAIESHYRFDFSLGVFYTIPVLIASAALGHWQIVFFALFAALARAPFTPAASNLEFFLKFAMAALAYTGTGLFVAEVSDSRRRLLENLRRLQVEQKLRRRAEEQLWTLAESSPAAILTLNADALVLAANRSAHDMLGFAAGTLMGMRVDSHLPMFANALKVAGHDRRVRTSVTGWARRLDDTLFPIQAWFSVYGLGDERCLAAIAVDMSEEVRERERENFQYLLDYNRLLASAVSHEIRNLCAAISVVCSNLGDQLDALHRSTDFDALLRLVNALRELSSFELRSTSDGAERVADLRVVLDQLRVVIEPDWSDIDGQVIWEVPEVLPPVAANAHALLQIFLNLCQNSLRAMEGRRERRLRIAVSVEAQDAVVTVADSGPGIADPSALFHLLPTRRSNGSGLGLYVSRELARSAGGELRHVPSPHGAQFRVVIPLVRHSREHRRVS